MTSNASTTMKVSVDAEFFAPVTSIVNVCLTAARLPAVKITAWTCSVVENVSTSVMKTPSRNTRAMPVCGPRKPTQLTEVPLKANVACALASVEMAAPPPLHALLVLS